MDQESQLAIGLSVALPNVFSSISGFVEPRVYAQTKDVAVALGVGVYFCIASFLAAIALIILDRKAMSHDK